MNPSPADILYEKLVEAKNNAQLANRPWGRIQILEVFGPFLESFRGEVLKGAAKERKRGAIHESADAVLNAYPRRQGGEAALIAISKAIAQDGLETVLAGTTEYASAVARWAYNRRVSQSGSSLIPLPKTWFGNRCYLDDPKYWWEGTGKAEKQEKEAVLLAEPEGWRFAHPDNQFVKQNIAWSAIHVDSQKWIIANTPQRRNTG